MAVNQSNLPTIQRLKFEDYANSADWKAAFQSLVNSLNLFMTPVYNILNGGVAYMNLQAPQLYTKILTSAAAATGNTFTFTNPLPIAPSAVIVGNVWTGLPSTHPTTCQVFWHYTGNSVVVDSVTGLTSGSQYTLVLVVL